MKIELIKPIINKIPKAWKQSTDDATVVEVTEWEEFQNGWDFGEGGYVGKMNEIIEWINSKNDQLL